MAARILWLPHSTDLEAIILSVPIPYREIADLLRQGQAIPFLGAGASLGNRPPKTEWDEFTTAFLPRGDELSLWLAEIIGFPSNELYDRSDLAKVSSYYAEMSGRDNLLPRLRKVFRRDSYSPCSIHIFLAELAKSAEITQSGEAGLLEELELPKTGAFKPLLIVTTNYDDLTETALQELGCPYDLVVHPTDRKDMAGSIMWWKHGAKEPEWLRANTLAIDLNKTTVLYKMHGTASKLLSEFDSYVITEEDYIDFLSLMTSREAIPQLFTTHFYTRQFLFLGYGLRDWNFRVMLKNLKEKPRSSREKTLPGELERIPDIPNPPTADARKRRELKSWAIQKDPSDLERVLWTARDVILFKEDLNEFVTGLRKHTPTLICHTNAKK
jgi:hypothetical protein